MVNPWMLSSSELTDGGKQAIAKNSLETAFDAKIQITSMGLN